MNPFSGSSPSAVQAFRRGACFTVLRATLRECVVVARLIPGPAHRVFPIEHGRPEHLYTAWELPKEDAGRENARSSTAGTSRLSAGRAFEPRLHFDGTSDGRLAVVDSIGYRIKLIARDGRVVGAVERPIAPIAVPKK